MPRWFFLSLFAVLCWGLWAILGKFVDTLTAGQNQALSTLGVLPVMLALLLSNKQKLIATANRRRGIFNAVLAGGLTCLGLIAYFHALSAGGKASNVVPLTALYPLVTVVLAVIFLHERLNFFQLGGIALSLISIYLFNVSSVEGAANTWLFYALIPIGLWGISGLFQKISTNDISGELSTLWFLATFVPVGAVILFFEPLSSHIALKTWLAVTGEGFFFSLGNLALLAALAANGKASIIAPMCGLYPLVSVPIAVFFLGEKISVRETSGIILALISVVCLAIEKSSVRATLVSFSPSNKTPNAD